MLLQNVPAGNPRDIMWGVHMEQCMVRGEFLLPCWETGKDQTQVFDRGAVVYFQRGKRTCQRQR